MHFGRAVTIAGLLAALSGCGDAEKREARVRRNPTAGKPDVSSPVSGPVAEGVTGTAKTVPRDDDFEVAGVLIGAGDIGRCSSRGHDQTARLLDDIAGTVFTLGDNAYPHGTATDFADCYGRSWGRHRARTRPTMGNHDYRTDEGAPYYDYFSDAAGPRGRGYYSYDLGDWHVLALNSVLSVGRWSAQIAWIRRDLESTKARCVVAYWHESRFSSGEHGNSRRMRLVWDILYAHGVDVVISAHDHNYERFAPQDPAGNPDPVRGIRAFVVGTGGAGLRPLGSVRPNSEVRDATRFGVLKLELGETGYRWAFITAPDGEIADSGTGVCH